MIEVDGVVKQYGRKNVLDRISFTAEKGQITCLIGINGVGKSTIMKAIRKPGDSCIRYLERTMADTAE